MKRRLGFLALLGITFFSLTVAFTATIAWFSSRGFDFTNDRINGQTQGAYFAYGNGKKAYDPDDPTTNKGDRPYGISNTRHLNNLAWLQYMGEFNKVKQGETQPEHVYFELAGDINKDGKTFCTLPIGTEDYPFIGVFNGNGYTIHNIKITNDGDAFSDVPRIIKDAQQDADKYHDTDAEIVGFFGVVGKLDTEVEAYSSSVNSIKNVNFDNITVESKTEETLIGIAAGFVNADMSGVKVGKSTISVNGNSAKEDFTHKLSDYGLVGFTTNEGMGGTNYSQEVSEYFYNGGGQGGGGELEGEGGSVRIKDYNNWFYRGPRDGNASITQGDSKSSNHIHSNSDGGLYDFQLHYNYQPTNIDPNGEYSFRFAYGTESFCFTSYTRGYYTPNGTTKYYFDATINTEATYATYNHISCYKLEFDTPVSIANVSGTYSTLYINHYNNANTSVCVYTQKDGRDRKKVGQYGLLKTTIYSLQNYVVYHLKDFICSEDKTIGGISYTAKTYNTYIPLKFVRQDPEDETSKRINAANDNTGYIIGKTYNDTASSKAANVKMASYSLHHISNSLGDQNGYTMSDINTGVGVGVTQFTADINNKTEILAYDQSSSSWVGIKDSHNSNFYGSNTTTYNSALGNKTLKTPKQLKLQKYEGYAGDESSSGVTEDAKKKPLARNSLKNMLLDEYRVNGIHFDGNSAIGYTDDKCATLDVAKIGAWDDKSTQAYEGRVTNVKMPKGSIDFNFSTTGYINFFAGTYSTTTTSMNFFSLYSIERSSDKKSITSMNEIVGVYKNSNFKSKLVPNHKTNPKYVYEYKGGGDSTTVENGAAKGELVYDVDKALLCSGSSKRAPVLNALYYFEIPVNDGEYAMGVCSSPYNAADQGAYMMYLDIGANADTVEKDGVTAHYIITHQNGNAYPKGIDFIPDGATIGINGGDSIGVYIPAEKNGDIEFTMDSSEIHISDTSSISVFSFQGNKYKDSDPPSGFFIVTTDTGGPGGLVGPSGGGTRVLKIGLTIIGGLSYQIRITDEIKENGSYTSVYEVDSGSGYEEIETNPEDYIRGLSTELNESTNLYRDLVVAAELVRKTGYTSAFATSYNTSECDYDNKIVNISITGLQDAVLDVNVTEDYIVVINNDVYEEGESTYPLQD